MEDLGKLTIASTSFILLYSMIAKHMHDIYHIPDPMVMMIYGIIIGKGGFRLLETHYVFSKTLISHTSRILLCLQTMAVALSVPNRYLKRNKWALFFLIVVGGFIKCGIIFLILISFSSMTMPTCWAIAASLTPTDPILSSSIIKGRFARICVPEYLRTLLAAESGINDGLGILMLNISVEVLHSYRRIFSYPINKSNLNEVTIKGFLYPSLINSRLKCHFKPDGLNRTTSIRQLLDHCDLYSFFGPNIFLQNDDITDKNTYSIFLRLFLPVWHFIVNTIFKKVILSAIIGYLIGYVTLKIARNCCAIELLRSDILIIHSFVLTFLGLALMDHIDGSELICIFFIGIALNADSWYFLEGSNRKMSEIVESIFSNIFFIFIGSLFDFSRMPSRIVIISMVIVIASRPVSIFLIRKLLPDIVGLKEALFIGWFGPIGVGALYYCILYDKAMHTLTIDFAMCIVFLSTMIHGISVPSFCVSKVVWRKLRKILQEN
ncbi:sodium/hydrogen antiporter [Pancytospora epiphaga]|nr:sodium/hydrogen antiporter [Pancytospora epiphaga]